MTCFDWFKDLNYREEFAGGIIGGLIGFGISKLNDWYVRCNNKTKLKNKFNPMCGDYYRTLNANEYVHAVVEYKYDSILEINTKTYTNNVMQEHWQGEIKMDTEQQGLIVWHHEHPPALDKNGFKRIIVSPDKKKITLLGEGEYGYGEEELRKE